MNAVENFTKFRTCSIPGFHLSIYDLLGLEIMNLLNGFHLKRICSWNFHLKVLLCI